MGRDIIAVRYKHYVKITFLKSFVICGVNIGKGYSILCNKKGNLKLKGKVFGYIDDNYVYLLGAKGSKIYKGGMFAWIASVI